ncbi:hypothetical protein K523DRAFT_421932 [Schizophyllum commune Tattone D]|nr:hypothetical protein K523DRAFT_421932 [Schizophyllum commune Tattone D]
MSSPSPCKPLNNRSSPPQPPRYGLNDLPPQGIPDIVSSRASFNGVRLTIGYLCLLRCISWHTTRIMLGGHAGIAVQFNGLPRGPVAFLQIPHSSSLRALGERAWPSSLLGAVYPAPPASFRRERAFRVRGIWRISSAGYHYLLVVSFTSVYWNDVLQ